MQNKYSLCFVSFIFFLCIPFTFAKDINSSDKTASASEKTPPKIGNFGLSSSQQIGPLISFGQNIIDKDQTQLFLGLLDSIGNDKNLLDILPSTVHQLTDNLSLSFSLPIVASYQEETNHSSGLADAILQFEYAFYNKETSRFSEQATVVGYASLPSGSPRKQPNTGLGSPSFFLGGTFARTYVDWYGFFSGGMVAMTSQNGIKFGDQYLYQCGIAKNLYTVNSKYIFAALLEVDGTYTEKTKIQGLTEPNSGGNVIYLTPSLWFSTKKLILQLGVGIPVTQHLFGEQRATHYLVAANIGWTF